MRSDLLRAAVIGVLGAVPVLWFGCSEGGAAEVTTTADADASPDAARADRSGRDAQAEAEADATIEEDPFAGTWVPVPGVPAYCEHKLAKDPAALASKWSVCPSGRAGCRRMDTSWTSLPGRTVSVDRQTDPVRLVGGVPYMKVRRYWPSKVAGNPYSAYADIVEPLDGAPLVAIGRRTSPSCWLEATFGDHGIGFYALPHPPGLPAEQSTHEIVLGWASWSSPSTFATKSVFDTDFAAPGLSISSITMGSSAFWFSVKAPTSIARFDVATQTGNLLADRPYGEHPVAAAGGAVFIEATEPFAIARAADDGTWSRLVTPTSPQLVTWVTFDRSNADALVWIESDFGLGYVNSTLWTAPLAASEGALSRKKVAKLDDALERGGSFAVANKGVILTLVDRNKALLTRLSDGMGWLIEGEPKERFTTPVWIDDGDVLIETAPDDPPGLVDLYPTGILRISRATLGPATVPSGL